MKTLLKTIATNLHQGMALELHRSTARILWNHIHKTGRRQNNTLVTDGWQYEFKPIVRRKRKLVIVTAKEVCHA